MAKTYRDIKELTSNAQTACNLFLEECKRQGLKVLVTETYRSQERQNELYAQGRTTKGNVVTWTKKSRHTSRRAWDICQNIKGYEYSDTNFFVNCGAVARKLGIIWGGDWDTPDMPHFEVDENWKKPKGVDEMTTEEKAKFNDLVNIVSELSAKVDKLTASQEKIYHYWKDIPIWAYAAVKRAYNKGVFKGSSTSDLNLPESLMRIIVMNDRLGLYDDKE